jgi:hypothetical protein
MAPHSWLCAGCAGGLLALAIGAAPPAAAEPGAAVAVVRASEGTATVTFDLAGLPGNALLVVERRLGPKSPYIEVARTAQDEGVMQVSVPSTRRAVVRATVMGTRGSVLMRTETTL